MQRIPPSNTCSCKCHKTVLRGGCGNSFTIDPNARCFLQRSTVHFVPDGRGEGATWGCKEMMRHQPLTVCIINIKYKCNPLELPQTPMCSRQILPSYPSTTGMLLLLPGLPGDDRSCSKWRSHCWRASDWGGQDCLQKRQRHVYSMYCMQFAIQTKTKKLVDCVSSHIYIYTDP